MTRHSFIQMSKLSNVKGRISYITSHARQENLYATYRTADNNFWSDLAKECQQEFKRSGADGKCIEAREWKVLISTKFAALPISERRRFLNSVAAARENVSIKSCSCFTSSSSSNAASLWTSTRVFPLPGPAATTIYFESASLMICA